MARQAIDPLEEEREEGAVFTFTLLGSGHRPLEFEVEGGLWNACQNSYFKMAKRSVVPDLTTLYCSLH